MNLDPISFLKDYASRLRFPRLFLLTATLFVVDLLIPDVVPFADEILLALVTALLASLKKQRGSGDRP
jgi:hypothetical protein